MGNITAGIDLIRRVEEGEAHASWRARTTAVGVEVRQDRAGALWIDPALTSPYNVLPVLVQPDDRDVDRI